MKLAMKALERHGRAAEALEFRTRMREAIEEERFTARLVRAIAEANPEVGARYVVNIGTHDGESWGDPCFELFSAGWAGVAIDARSYPEIHRTLPQPTIVKLMDTFVTPDNVAGLLSGAGCPADFDLLKIDIDSFDGPILEAVLRSFRPSVIHIEVNPEIPPPIAFSIDYDRRYAHSAFGGFFGCSVSFVTSLCRPLGYELVRVDPSNPPVRQDAVLVRKDRRPVSFPPILDERAAFMRQPLLLGSFRDIGVDSRPWRGVTDRQTLLAEGPGRARQSLDGAVGASAAVPPRHRGIGVTAGAMLRPSSSERRSGPGPIRGSATPPFRNCTAAAMTWAGRLALTYCAGARRRRRRQPGGGHEIRHDIALRKATRIVGAGNHILLSAHRTPSSAQPRGSRAARQSSP